MVLTSRLRTERPQTRTGNFSITENFYKILEKHPEKGDLSDGRDLRLTDN